jgi:FdhE protein
VSGEPVVLETVASRWGVRRLRAEELRARHPFADEVLTLYLALLPAQERTWSAVRDSPAQAGELPRWAAAQVLPAVVEATIVAGPAALGEAARRRLAEGTAEDALAGWLRGAELDPVDRYLARASLAPVLEALGEQAGAACARVPDGEQSELCPCCGGQPQLSCVATSGESLVSGPRSLLCARCGSSWSCSRSTCPACGESDDARLEVHAEAWHGPVSGNGTGDGEGRPLFPQLRIAGCATCHHYLIEIDMERDVRAVPEVDELAALPLDLYAADQGLTKVTPNLMGF